MLNIRLLEAFNLARKVQNLVHLEWSIEGKPFQWVTFFSFDHSIFFARMSFELCLSALL